MLYDRPLEDLGIADIEAFVKQQHKESEILDYKEAWPKDLAKVIAAMANTQGGLILVGVSEQPGTGRPVRPREPLPCGRRQSGAGNKKTPPSRGKRTTGPEQRRGQ